MLEIILFVWTENFSTQGPEHCHIEFCKNLAQCTNNKDVFLAIMQWHVLAAHLQYLHNLNVDLAEANANDDDLEDPRDWMARHTQLEADKNDGVSCELGIRYPTLHWQCIRTGPQNHLRIKVVLIIRLYNVLYW